MRAQDGPAGGLRARMARWILGVAMLATIGCSRTHYRQRADRDVYDIQAERLIDPRWRLPGRPVEAAPQSRLRDPFDPDREPIPPDDPAARVFQVSARKSPHEFHGWAGRGAAHIEDLSWRAHLPVGSDGNVALDRESVMRLAVLHSREYQDQVEQVYLTALALSLARFEFQVQPFFRQNTAFQHFGAPSNDSNQLQLNTNAGFRRNLATGGQLLVDFANAMVFEFSGPDMKSVSSTLLVGLTQPLLRGAFARIRTQELSLAERNMLYDVRDFARFRRGFYVQVVSGNGYLGLLNQVQSIRNQEELLQALRRNLEETELLRLGGRASLTQRDQVAQAVQQAEFGLVSSRAGLEGALDAYKLDLGLPPELPTRLDDAPLDLFELNDPRFEALRQRSEELRLSLLQPDTAPPNDVLAEAARTLRGHLAELDTLFAAVNDELRRLQARSGQLDAEGNPLPLPEASDETTKRRAELAGQLGETLKDVRDRLDAEARDVEALSGKIGTANPDATWKALRDLVGRDFRSRLSDLVAAEAQVRAFLIDLTPVALTLDEAIQLALCNRQDLMNAKGQVTDAWRNIEVSADRLQADLNVRYDATLATDPDRDDPFRFDASSSRHRVGLEFDAPLTRRAERNAYRASQVGYQRARRNYMAVRDRIVQQVRADMRQIELNRRQFEISREQLITAARRVDELEYNIRNTPNANESLTLFLIDSLRSRQGARDSLIRSWIDYQTSRMSLYRDLDLMDIDARGTWTNEHRDPTVDRRPVVSGPPELATDLDLPPLPPEG